MIASDHRRSEQAAPSPSQQRSDAHSLRRVLTLRDFRLLLGGTSTSLLGDQFALIATPWLALQLTGDPLAVGLVLALEGIPRAGFMIVGGAFADRVSPRRAMLLCDIVRLVLTAGMAALVLSGGARMWMVYGFAIGFGTVAGFAIPAENSLVPRIVRRDDLQAGNAVIMGASQLARFVGPAAAGALVAIHTDWTRGVGIAYAIDAATFGASAGTFAFMRRQPVTDRADGGGLVASMLDGVGHLRADPALRWVFWLLMSVNLFAVGPLLVGIPLLANDRLSGTAMAFGVLMGAFAAGNLIGYLVAGICQQPSGRTMTVIVFAVLGGFGLVIASLGIAADLVVDTVLLTALGVGNGYLGIGLFTWIQARTPEALLGRTMSLVTFASLGLVSVSQAAAGAVARWDLDVLFLVSGGLVIAAAASSTARPGRQAFITSLADREPPHSKEPTP